MKRRRIYPEFAKSPVERGINSISLSPDAAIQTTHTIPETEKESKQKQTAAK